MGEPRKEVVREYELVVVFHPDLEIDIDRPLKKVVGLIEATGGKIKNQENLGKRRLAYRIGRQDFGVYVVFDLELDPLKVDGLEKNLNITEEVMRSLMVKVNEPRPQEPKKASKSAPAESEAVNG